MPTIPAEQMQDRESSRGPAIREKIQPGRSFEEHRASVAASTKRRKYHQERKKQMPAAGIMMVGCGMQP